MNTLEMPTERCAELAEFFLKVEKDWVDFMDGSTEPIEFVYGVDGKRIETRHFNPTNADAYFLLKQAIENREDFLSIQEGFSGSQHWVVINSNFEAPVSWANKNEILALFLAAYELMKRVQREQEG